MVNYALAMGLILAVLSGWIMVDQFSRRFAARHPEYGERRECMGCGLAALCSVFKSPRKHGGEGTIENGQDSPDGGSID